MTKTQAVKEGDLIILPGQPPIRVEAIVGNVARLRFSAPPGFALWVESDPSIRTTVVSYRPMVK